MNRLRSALVVWRVLLGICVLLQIVYLFASLLFNLEEAFRSQFPIPWVQAANEEKLNGVRQYGQMTAQRQRWSLFAPEAAKEFAFLEMQLRWDDEGLEAGSVPVHPLEPITLLAKDAPDQLNAFVRLGGFRVRKYEASITPGRPRGEVVFGTLDPREDQVAAHEIYEDADRMFAYLRWRLADFRRTHPDLPPPSQVLLWVHNYRIPEPPGPEPWRWEDCGVDCVGYWLPEQDVAAPGKER